jgi:hypothetical protein
VLAAERYDVRPSNKKTVYMLAGPQLGCVVGFLPSIAGTGEADERL